MASTTKRTALQSYTDLERLRWVPLAGRPLNSVCLRDGLAGWACRIRTGESARELSDWNSVATLPEVVQARRRRPFACELRDTDLQLRPTFQQTIFRAADTADPETASHEPSNVCFGSDRPRSMRCSFVASHVRSGLGYRSSGCARDPVHRLLMTCE
jgi:hypothetical protein